MAMVLALALSDWLLNFKVLTNIFKLNVLMVPTFYYPILTTNENEMMASIKQEENKRRA